MGVLKGKKSHRGKKEILSFFVLSVAENRSFLLKINQDK
jgi:hypothetical protein